jgi:hypothetical protein
MHWCRRPAGEKNCIITSAKLLGPHHPHVKGIHHKNLKIYVRLYMHYKNQHLAIVYYKMLFSVDVVYPKVYRTISSLNLYFKKTSKLGLNCDCNTWVSVSSIVFYRTNVVSCFLYILFLAVSCFISLMWYLLSMDLLRSETNTYIRALSTIWY